MLVSAAKGVALQSRPLQRRHFVECRGSAVDAAALGAAPALRHHPHRFGVERRRPLDRRRRRPRSRWRRPSTRGLRSRATRPAPPRRSRSATSPFHPRTVTGTPSVQKLKCAVIGAAPSPSGSICPRSARCPGHRGVRHRRQVGRSRASRSPRSSACGEPSTDYRDVIGARRRRDHRPPASAPRAGRRRSAQRRHPRARRKADGAVAGGVRRDDRGVRRDAGAVLAVGLLRRCSPSLQWVKRCARRRTARADSSRSISRKAPSTDGRSHRRRCSAPRAAASSPTPDRTCLDLVLWWFGDYRRFTYRDDAMGGVEADCLLDLEMARRRARARRVEPHARHAQLLHHHRRASARSRSEPRPIPSSPSTWTDGTTLGGRGSAGGRPSPTNLIDLFEPQLRQFVNAIRFRDRPVVSGVEARRSVALLSACYQARQPWTHPWDAGAGAAVPEMLSEVAQ